MKKSSLFGALLVCGATALGCSGAGEETVGVRADGLTVSCAEHGESVYDCTPQPPSDPGACATWTAGGPALVLWPPNHRMQRISLDDCARVRKDCATEQKASVNGSIVSVTSDEAAKGNGSGKASDDIVIVDARTVEVRSERNGGGDGRVYKLAVKDSDGHEDVCEVHVPHDQGPHGGAADSGEAVRVTAPAQP